MLFGPCFILTDAFFLPAWSADWAGAGRPFPQVGHPWSEYLDEPLHVGRPARLTVVVNRRVAYVGGSANVGAIMRTS